MESWVRLRIWNEAIVEQKVRTEGKDFMRFKYRLTINPFAGKL